MTDMTLEEAVRARRSVRGFLPKPVPKALMTQVFELAQWAPVRHQRANPGKYASPQARLVMR